MGIPDISAEDATKIVRRSLRDTKLLAADTAGDGDNLIVKVQAGEPFNNLAEWRETASLSAKSSNGALVFADQTSVGRRKAFRFLERHPDPTGSVYFGYMEIIDSRSSVVSISITVDGESETVAKRILDSVKPSS